MARLSPTQLEAKILPSSAKKTSPQNWKLLNYSIGYIEEDVVIGQRLVLNFGLMNVGSSRVKVEFPYKQILLMKVYDDKGALVYEESPDDTQTGAPVELEPKKGMSWPTTLELKSSTFVSKGVYTVTLTFRSSNHPAMLAIGLNIP